MNWICTKGNCVMHILLVKEITMCCAVLYFSKKKKKSNVRRIEGGANLKPRRRPNIWSRPKTWLLLNNRTSRAKTTRLWRVSVQTALLWVHTTPLNAIHSDCEGFCCSVNCLNAVPQCRHAYLILHNITMNYISTANTNLFIATIHLVQYSLSHNK